ncbi:LysR family transcriptional regulator [Staphylococcus ureilyticus]|uniref:LysR family transcriptional regulator n=1 Tax=Staphylococcus ureilyticus TaxID=94138 RepID=UPI00387A8EFC
MENRVLRYFLAVVAEGNISAAAKLLHITQPTLSRQIKDLEEELSVTLFNRKGKYLELTREGHYLASKARDIINLVDKTTSNITHKEVFGEVHIGMAESSSIKPIARAIKALRKEYNQIIFDTFSGNAEQILEKINDGIIDFGVIIEPINKVDYDSIALNRTDVWGVLTKHDSEFKDMDKISAESIINKPLIISRQQGVKKMILNELDLEDVQLNVVAKYNLLYNASIMVEEGVGHALCLGGIVNTHNTSLRFVPFQQNIKSSLSVVWKKEKPLSISAQLFLNQLKEILKGEK